jgi:hypothetical protein
MVSDGTDIYVAMVDEFAGGRATLWKISDTTVSVHGATGYTPKTYRVSITIHDGKLITGYQTVPPIGTEIGKNVLMVQNGTTNWSAHSELPCPNSFSGWGMDVFSFNNRLFATCEERYLSDTASFWEYKNSSWSLLGAKQPIWQSVSRFFQVGSSLYHAFYGNNTIQVRKLGASGFTTVGPPLTGFVSGDDDFALSEDALGRPVIGFNYGNFPTMGAKTYRLENGSWNLIQDFVSTGSVDALSLLRVSEGLLLFYHDNSNIRNYILNESTGKWENHRNVGGLGTGPMGNLTQFQLISTKYGLNAVTIARESLGISRLDYCTGY